MSVGMQGVLLYAANATSDLTGKLFYWMKIDSAGGIVVAGANDSACGVLVEEGVAGAPASIQLDGIAKVACNAAIAAGAKVGCDSDGRAKTYASGDVLGIALNAAGAAGDVISVKMTF